MIVYIENPIDSIKKQLNLTSEFVKTVKHKINIQKLKAFFYTSNKISETEIRKNPAYDSNKKNKVPRNKLNQRGKSPVLRKLHNTDERN